VSIELYAEHIMPPSGKEEKKKRLSVLCVLVVM